MSVQSLGANGAGITTLINIGYIMNSTQPVN